MRGKPFGSVWGTAALAALALAMGTAQAAVAPRISGTPAVQATVNVGYRFQPKAYDADGNKLRFAISNRPAWATFDTATGRLSGRPGRSDIGSYADIRIRVTDGTYYRSIKPFSITVRPPARKAAYGHYFATRYRDTPDDVAMLCGQAGVNGVVWRRTWKDVEPSPGVYDFSSFDSVLAAIAGSHNPQCRIWIFVEFKSFTASPESNPCPAYLQARHSGPNAHGHGAASCFMWEPVVRDAYVAMMKAAGARYDANPRVEGFIVQESALGFNGAYSQDVAAGGTYTAAAWRDALVEIVGQCGAAFQRSRCLAYLNFIRGGQRYLGDVSRALSAIPDNRGCMSGPDLLPDARTLYSNDDAAYEVLARHSGCRSNSAQNDSFEVKNCGLDCIFNFAVRGNYGDFDQHSPRSSGVCVNSYLFWNHRVAPSATGLDWTDALPVIAAYPYGRGWLEQCQGDNVQP